VIATKAGYRFSRIANWMGFAKPLLKRVLRTVRGSRRIAGEIRSGAPKMKLLDQDFSAASVKAALEGSLRRLQTDYVDLYFLHDVPLDVLNDDALFSVLDELKRAGKIRQLGVSSNNAAVLERALKRAGVSVAQTAVNPGRPHDLWSALAKLQQAGVGVVANQVFNSGKLLATKDAALQERLSRLQREKQMTGTQILLQFAAAQPAVFSVLTGTTKPEHLKQNAAEISSVSKLTAEEISFLRGDPATLR
jgi:aryl-alcohol dehydrogenase-like predicted oxidoreductase